MLRLASGILSRPASPLASLPPDVDVPLPLGFALVELPVVGEADRVAELAAGSPETEPGPLGPPCASANVADKPRKAASITRVYFMAHAFRLTQR